MHVAKTGSSALRASLAFVVAVSACVDSPSAPRDLEPAPVTARSSAQLQCDSDNAGITLPPGFCAIAVADLRIDGAPARARHMAVTENGDVFVAINSPGNRNPSFGIIGLRDNDGDGRADQQAQFSPGLGGSGMAWNDGLLYFGANDRVLRFSLPGGILAPESAPEIVVSGLPNTGDHISKTVVLADAGRRLFVNIGSASNACQVANRQLESPGVFPCPELRCAPVCGHSMRSEQTRPRPAASDTPRATGTWLPWR